MTNEQMSLITAHLLMRGWRKEPDGKYSMTMLHRLVRDYHKPQHRSGYTTYRAIDRTIEIYVFRGVDGTGGKHDDRKRIKLVDHTRNMTKYVGHYERAIIKIDALEARAQRWADMKQE